MKKGSEWFKLLSEKEQQEFKENCEDFEYIMEKECGFYNFLLSSFIWIETPQGNRYWQEILNRYE